MQTAWFFYFCTMITKGPIGVFDSGYGGLTVLKEIARLLPAYDYIYLGDNARAPYGPRSFDTVFNYTLQCVQWFFKQNCPLVILACNTASAKALRTIQQTYLPKNNPEKKVLGVIRPTTERVGEFTQTGNVGVLGTNGTIQSNSYTIEIEKFFPEIKVYQQACPMWVPLIENGEFENEGADFFIKKSLDALLNHSHNIDTVLLACTHYPIIKAKIEHYLPGGINVVSQGEIVAHSLVNYMQRHKEVDEKCTKNGSVKFFTTDTVEDFNRQGGLFYGKPVNSEHVSLS